MKHFPAILLGLGAAMFLVMGVAFFVAPADMGDLVHLDGRDPTSRVELRAMYGGLEVGVGLFLFGCLIKQHLRTGLTVCAFAYGGLGLGRLAGLLMQNGWQGDVASIHWTLVAAEIAALILAVYGVSTLPERN